MVDVMLQLMRKFFKHELPFKGSETQLMFRL